MTPTNFRSTTRVLRRLLRPFEPTRTATEKIELLRLAWWLRYLYGHRDDWMYSDTSIAPGCGVHAVFNLFRGHLTYGGFPVANEVFYDLQIGGRRDEYCASLYNIRRMNAQPWERTSFDLPVADMRANSIAALLRTMTVVRVTRPPQIRRMPAWLARRWLTRAMA